MNISFLLLLVECSMILITSAKEESKDLPIQSKDLEDNEELERRHRRRKKGQNNGGSPCGYGGGGFGGHGKTFGEKLFGLQDYTYISAPVMNYYFGCGVAALPIAPQIAPFSPVGHVQPIPYPINVGVSQSQSNSGFGHGGFGGHGRPGRPGHFGGFNQDFNNQQPAFNHQPAFNQPQPYQGGYNQGGYNQGGYNQGQYQQRPYNRPFQNVVSAAASGLGNALADYITTRPRKTYKQFNKQVNQFLKPLYKLF